MAKIAALAGLLLLMANAPARAEPNFAVWRVAHERLLCKWRHSEPRCGWTVGGYTCGSPKGSHRSHAYAR
jgi:hypothetical protein